jgi:hypothetical protein
MGTWLLTFYKQGKIHLKQLIVLLQATVLHRFAPGTSSSPVSLPSTSGPGATHSVSSPLPGHSGKTVSSPINISSVASSSKENKALSLSKLFSSVKQKSDSSYAHPHVSPSSKKISKIFCISTRIENKVDRLTESRMQKLLIVLTAI